MIDWLLNRIKSPAPTPPSEETRDFYRRLWKEYADGRITPSREQLRDIRSKTPDPSPAETRTILDKTNRKGRSWLQRHS